MEYKIEFDLDTIGFVGACATFFVEMEQQDSWSDIGQRECYIATGNVTCEDNAFIDDVLAGKIELPEQYMKQYEQLRYELMTTADERFEA